MLRSPWPTFWNQESSPMILVQQGLYEKAARAGDMMWREVD